MALFGGGFWPSVCHLSALFLVSLALAFAPTQANGTGPNGSISLYDIPCPASNCCISTPDTRSVPPDTCVNLTSITGWTIHNGATCANGTAALMAIFGTSYCDDSKIGPFGNNLGHLSPGLLNLCLNSGLNSIAFYCDGANGTINVADDRPPRPAPTLLPAVPALMSVYPNASCLADHYDSYSVQPDVCFARLGAAFVLGQGPQCADRSVRPRYVAFGDAACTTEVPFGVMQTAPFPGCYASQGFAAVAFRCNDSLALTSGGFSTGGASRGLGGTLALVLFVGLASAWVL